MVAERVFSEKTFDPLSCIEHISAEHFFFFLSIPYLSDVYWQQWQFARRRNGKVSLLTCRIR